MNPGGMNGGGEWKFLSVAVLISCAGNVPFSDSGAHIGSKIGEAIMATMISGIPFGESAINQAAPMDGITMAAAADSKPATQPSHSSIPSLWQKYKDYCE